MRYEAVVLSGGEEETDYSSGEETLLHSTTAHHDTAQVGLLCTDTLPSIYVCLDRHTVMLIIAIMYFCSLLLFSLTSINFRKLRVALNG